MYIFIFQDSHFSEVTKFQDFYVFQSKIPGIFKQKFTFSTILQSKNPSFPACFSNLEGSALFQPHNKNQKVEY